MILDKIYQQFIEHTGLTDGIYKSVFIQISEVLEQISNVTFLSLKYNTGDTEVEWDFSQKSEIPNYVVEIVRNLFEQFYTLPTASTVVLNVSYADHTYQIVSHGESITIPEPLMFIKKYLLCTYFINDSLVYEPFDDFERYFKFIYIMCQEKEYPIKELQALFHDAATPKESIFNIESQSLDELNSLLANLTKVRLGTLDMLDEERIQREKLNMLRLQTANDLSERNSVLENKLRLDREYQEIQEEQETYANNIQQSKQLVADIEKELMGYVSSSSNDAVYLREKKFKLVKSIEHLTESHKQIQGMASGYQTKLNSLKNDIMKYGTVSDHDLSQITEQVSQLDMTIATQENLVTNYDSKIAEICGKMQNTSEFGSKAPINTDYIFAKLSSLGYSKPIVVVLNYLKNLFTYHVLRTTNAFVKDRLFAEQAEHETLYAQTIAVRHVLSELLGLTFENMFSSLTFDHPKYTHVIKIVRNQ